jgi:hypothetical protein
MSRYSILVIAVLLALCPIACDKTVDLANDKSAGTDSD